MKDKKNYIVLIGVISVIGIGVYLWNGFNSEEVEHFVAANLSGGTVTGASEDSDTVLFVQVTGEVLKPGVYQLKAGSRVYEAVALAGGTTTSAAIEVVNQAQLLEDGDQIYFPTRTTEADISSSLININTASIEELQKITGIGEAKALSIINYREEFGRFESIEDLMLVDGIKEGLFSKMKEDVTIY